MARRKKKSPKKKINLNDERIPKIAGIVLLFVSVYLLIAFVSYFFTWQNDQDKVLKFSWNIITQTELTVDNWLGRLGAFVSNFFMYWGFGVSSILIVPVLIKLAIDMIRRSGYQAFFHWFRIALVAMAFCSIVVAFLSRNSLFNWGGVFGQSINLYLINFIGSIGIALLLTCIFIGITIWYLNPRFEQFILATEGLNYKIPSFDFFKMPAESPKAKPKRKIITNDSLFETEAVSKTDDEVVSQKKDPTQLDLSTSSDLTTENPIPEEPKIIQPKPQSREDLEDELQLNIVEKAPETQSDLPDAIASLAGDNPKHIPHTEIFDPTNDLKSYVYPTLDMLEDYADQKVEIDRQELEDNKNQIVQTLQNYKIEITKIRATIGPTVTLYEIIPAPGVKISKIKNLEDDIALSLAALGIRIIAPIPGKGTIGIEVPNKNKNTVSLKEVLKSDKFQNAKMDLPIALGRTISNEVFVADLAKMPHLLIAGATGQGKSVGINTVLMSLLYKKHPSQVKLILIDPKKVELFPYGHLDKHFLGFLPNDEEPIVTETKKVVYTLNSLCIEMDERYDLLKKARARNIKEYNKKFVDRKLNPNNGHRYLPFIVLVIDEFADLIMTAGKEVEMPIARIAQLARAVGMHLIIATQRPSVNIITGIIKANFPARIAFKVTSKIDSRTILDAGGADQLIGRGDMLLSVGGNVVRLQCAFVDTPEVERVIDHIGDQKGFPEPFYLPEFVNEDDKTAGSSGIKKSDLDEHFDAAAKMVVGTQSGSTSMLQRKMQLGYNRAGRIMDQLEALHIVGPANGSKPREVYIMSEMELLDHLERIFKAS